MGLVLDDETRPTSLQCAGGGRNRLDHAIPAVGVDQLAANLDVVRPLATLGNHRREHSHGVLRLLLGHRRDLHPRLRVVHRDGLVVIVPTGETARADQLDAGNRCGQRILAVPLASLEDPIAIDEPSTMIDRIPPQDEARLLGGVLPRLTGWMLEPLGRPAQSRPAQGVLRQDELAVLATCPGRPDVDGLVLRGGRGHVWPATTKASTMAAVNNTSAQTIRAGVNLNGGLPNPPSAPNDSSAPAAPTRNSAHQERVIGRPFVVRGPRATQGRWASARCPGTGTPPATRGRCRRRRTPTSRGALVASTSAHTLSSPSCWPTCSSFACSGNRISGRSAIGSGYL